MWNNLYTRTSCMMHLRHIPRLIQCHDCTFKSHRTMVFIRYTLGCDLSLKLHYCIKFYAKKNNKQQTKLKQHIIVCPPPVVYPLHSIGQMNSFCPYISSIRQTRHTLLRINPFGIKTAQFTQIDEILSYPCRYRITLCIKHLKLHKCNN